jgi:adenylate cyclase
VDFLKIDIGKSMKIFILKRIYSEIRTIRNWLLAGCIFGALFAIAEYWVRLNTDYPQALIPLIIRSMMVGSIILVSVAIFELSVKNRFIQKSFLQLVLIKSFSYTLIITLWLSIMNIIWMAITQEGSVFKNILSHYLKDEIFLINLATIGLGAIVLAGLGQINSLHRKGELINFILGKYHTPREVGRIFCFIDLKGSTMIAEKLGHFRFAMFLKDYYSDITGALRKTDAQIYQYVGDEIVLSWSYENGLRNNNLIECFFQMKEIITGMKQKYINKYGFYPEFKAGMHGGQVIVTWIGEMKKEIVYIGDVLNTAARIQEDCKRLEKDFLISEELLNRIDRLDKINASFVEETIPRGKENKIRLYSLDS